MDQTQLDRSLGLLEYAQLVHPLYSTELEYMFRHALVQEAAYTTLLKNRRRRLHQVIGEELERVNATDLGSIAPLLGYHFTEAGDYERAAKFHILAGDSAERLFAPVEARLHFEAALANLAKMPSGPERLSQEIIATTGYATVAFGSDPPQEILARLKQVESLAEEQGMKGGARDRDTRHIIARLRYWIGRLLNITNQPAEAIAYYRLVLRESSDLDDEELTAVPSGEIGLVLARQGYYGQAIPLLGPGIAYLEKTADWQHWTYLVAHLAMSLVARGQVASGFQRSDQMMRRAVELNSKSAIAVCHLFNSYIYMLGGERRKSLDASSACVEIASETGELLLVNMAYGFRAWAEGRLGRYLEAQASLERQAEIAKRLGGQFVLPDQFAAMSAEVALLSGMPEKALDLAKSAVDLSKQMSGIFAEGFAERVWAQALAAARPEDVQEAEDHFAASIQAFEAGECLVELARTRLTWGSLAIRWGNLKLAAEQLGMAANEFSSAGLSRELDQALGLEVGLRSD